MPAPMIPLMVTATRSQRRIPRTSPSCEVGFIEKFVRVYHKGTKTQSINGSCDFVSVVKCDATIWSAPAERSDDGALDKSTPKHQNGVAQRPPQRGCRAGDPGCLPPHSKLLRDVLQCFSGDFLIVEMKSLAPDDLVILMSLPGD